MKLIYYTNSTGEKWVEKLPDDPGVRLARFASISYHVNRYGGAIHAVVNFKVYGQKFEYKPITVVKGFRS